MLSPLFSYRKLLVLFCAAQLFSGEEVGHVVAIYGNAVAQRDGGEEEILNSSAPIYTHDMLKIDKGSIAQIRLTDGSLLNFTADTHYKITNYSFQKQEFVSELFQGGMRGISGSISKNNPQGMVIKTPTAVMGVLGTIFEIFVEGGNRTFFGCESGEVTMRNLAGELSVGPSRPNQFGVSTSQSAKPRAIDRRPEPLQLNRYILPRGCG